MLATRKIAAKVEATRIAAEVEATRIAAMIARRDARIAADREIRVRSPSC